MARLLGTGHIGEANRVGRKIRGPLRLTGARAQLLAGGFARSPGPERPMRPGPERAAEERKSRRCATCRRTRSRSALTRTNEFDGWVPERLCGLNSNVRYVHNKFMLVDPLSDNPVVVAGSANFSEASTDGERREHDDHQGRHPSRRHLPWRVHAALQPSRVPRVAAMARSDDPPKPLRVDDWWTDYFGDTERATRRRFFAPGYPEQQQGSTIASLVAASAVDGTERTAVLSHSSTSRRRLHRRPGHRVHRAVYRSHLPAVTGCSCRSGAS